MPLPRHRGFTVLELTLALAIAGVLLVLLTLSFRSFSRLSDDTRCLNHLRTIGQQSLLYFSERNGNLFPTWNWFRDDTFLALLAVTPPHSGVKSHKDTVFTCPAFKKEYPTYFPSSLNRCYSINYYAHYFRPGDQQGSNALPDPADWRRLFPGNLRNVRNPFKMWMFMDAARSTGIFTYYNHGHIPYMGQPHNHKAQAVFFDGHIEPVVPERLSQPGSSDFWGGPLP